MDFNSRYYLLESVQQVVEAIGSNCVLTGLAVNSISVGSFAFLIDINEIPAVPDIVDDSGGMIGGPISPPLLPDLSNILNIHLTKGKVICDSTLIEFPDDITLHLNLRELPTQGRIILSVNYRYLRTSRPNLAAISLKYLDNNNVCTEWFSETDKIVLGIINYDKTQHTITFNRSRILNREIVNINNIEYEVYPYNLTIQQLRPVLLQLFNT